MNQSFHLGDEFGTLGVRGFQPYNMLYDERSKPNRASVEAYHVVQSRPKAILIEPRVREAVNRDLLIRLEFSEIIDVGPFFGTNASTGPIRFLIRRVRPVIDPFTGMGLPHIRAMFGIAWQ